MRLVNLLFFLAREWLQICVSALWGPGPLHKGTPPPEEGKVEAVSPRPCMLGFSLGLDLPWENPFYAITATTKQTYVKDSVFILKNAVFFLINVSSHSARQILSWGREHRGLSELGNMLWGVLLVCQCWDLSSSRVQSEDAHCSCSSILVTTVSLVFIRPSLLCAYPCVFGILWGILSRIFLSMALK